MSTSSERPVPRSRPRRPADETDPVLPGRPSVPLGPLPTDPVPAAPIRRRELTGQLNLRVSADILELVDRLAGQTGKTKRQVVEHALRSTYEAS